MSCWIKYRIIQSILDKNSASKSSLLTSSICKTIPTIWIRFSLVSKHLTMEPQEILMFNSLGVSPRTKLEIFCFKIPLSISLRQKSNNNTHREEIKYPIYCRFNNSSSWLLFSNIEFRILSTESRLVFTTLRHFHKSYQLEELVRLGQENKEAL